MIHYILQTIAFQLLFLVVYDLFLKRETFFNWNRAYLIITPLLSFILPLIKIDAIQKQIPQEFIIQLPAVLLGNASPETVITALDAVEIGGAPTSWSFFEIIITIWGVGALIALLYFSYKWYKILLLKQSGTISKIENKTLVLLPDTDVAFSFFHTIFIGEALSEKQKQHILLHEKIHVHQLHTWDLLFFEFLKIVFWFNPLVYVFQKRTTELQEFIADSEVAAFQKDKFYYNELLNHAFKTENISFITTFFNHSLIKKRIIMLQKSKSNRLFQLKYLLLVPVIIGMLTYTSCAKETAQSTSEDLSVEIANLTAQISSKENLSDEEKAQIAKMIYTVYPDGVEGISGEKGNIVYNKREVVEAEQLAGNNFGDSVPFAVIEKVPQYPGCSGDNATLKKCFSDKITKFILKNFNTKVGKDESVAGKQRIVSQFKIDKKGNIVDIKVKAKYPSLEKETIRVLSKLPKMVPGEERGKPVGVMYSLPIVFEINE